MLWNRPISFFKQRTLLNMVKQWKGSKFLLDTLERSFMKWHFWQIQFNKTYKILTWECQWMKWRSRKMKWEKSWRNRQLEESLIWGIKDNSNTLQQMLGHIAWHSWGALRIAKTCLFLIRNLKMSLESQRTSMWMSLFSCKCIKGISSKRKRLIGEEWATLSKRMRDLILPHNPNSRFQQNNRRVFRYTLHTILETLKLLPMTITLE